MGTATKIEWCDHTASPWYGCAHAELPGGGMHPGCDNCYAEALSKRNPGTLGEWGPAGVRFVSKSFYKACRRYQAVAQSQSRRVSVFPSLCDPFEDWKGNLHFTEKNDQGETESTVAWWRSDIGVCRAGETTVGNVRGERLATMTDCRLDLFSSIDANRMVDYLLLTKRPQNIRRMWPRLKYVRRRNVQLLYSASDQQSLEAGAGEMFQCVDLVPVVGLSLEPLLGPIDLRHWIMPMISVLERRFRWVIVGGESGPHARPCNVEWIRDIVHQCEAAAVPCFVKQLGANVYDSAAWEDGNEFTSYVQWVNKAGSWLGGVSGGGYRYKKPEKAICVDAAGRHCHRGEGFMRADAEGTFPVKWHFPIDLADGKGGDWNEWPADLRVREFPEVARG